MAIVATNDAATTAKQQSQVLAATAALAAALGCETMSEDERFNPQSKMRLLRGRGGVSDYLDVKWRKVWIKDEVDRGAFGADAALTWESEVVQLTENAAVVRATVTIADANGRLVRRAVSHGSETASDFGDFIEKAETKAYGRALECLGYGTAAAAEEPDNRPVDAPLERGDEAAGSVDATETPPRNYGALHAAVEAAFRREGDGLAPGVTPHVVAHDLACAKYGVGSLKDLTDAQLGELRRAIDDFDAAMAGAAWERSKVILARRGSATAVSA